MASSEITIVEQSGLQRTLVLRGAGLPFMGANWAGALRLVTTWYPGNATRATQQVLGPMDPPSNWTGEWNTTRLVTSRCQLRGKGSTALTDVVLAHDLVRLFESFARGGSLMLVTWKVDPQRDLLGTPIEIVRLGRCSQWNFPYERIDDIPWTMTWEWVGRGGQQQVAIELDQYGSTALLNQLEVACLGVDTLVNKTTMATANRKIPKQASKFSLGKLEQLLNAPNLLMKDLANAANSIVNRLNDVANLGDKARRVPFEVANQALDLSRNAVAIANNFVDKMSRTPPEQMQTQQSLSSLTRAASYFGAGTTQAQYISQQADKAAVWAQQAAQASGGAMKPVAIGTARDGGLIAHGRVPPNNTGGTFTQPLEVYLSKAGDTFLSISVAKYGSVDYALPLKKANGYPIGAVSPVAGKVLVIPPVSALQALMTTSGRPPGPALAPGELPTLPGGVIPPPGNPNV